MSREKLRALLHYNKLFYAVQSERSGRSAREVVGLVNEMLRPGSVIDVGCGVGAWLAEWHRLGVSDMVGIDGDWVDRRTLKFPAEQFVAHELTQPYESTRSFDLVMCLEVAEDFEPDDSGAFVDLLTSLGPVIMFSAAIPQQGGQHHVNERWQGDWARDFEQRGYVVVDCVRPQIWENRNVQVWYRQNTLLYIKRDALAESPELQALVDKWGNSAISVVHPDFYSTMFLRGVSGFVRQYRGIRAKTVVKGLFRR